MSRQRNLQICTNEDVDDNQKGSPLNVDENLQLDEQQIVDLILRRCKRQRKAKSFEPFFELFLVQGRRSEISSSIPYLLNVEGDPLTYGDAMASHNGAFRKDTINDEMQSVKGNNT